MKTVYDSELLNLLKNKIDDGIIKVNENVNIYFEEIEKSHSIGFNGIDWLKNSYIYFLDLRESEPEHLKKTNHFLANIADNFPQLMSETIVVIGDSLTSLGFEMKFADFIELHELFFNIPQHTYIWFPVSKKCINLTFENELYFG
ncbi:MAG TPA: hypothetical protein VGF30_04300 [Bacteroidia bacterium]